jgi:hypothetical protein
MAKTRKTTRPQKSSAKAKTAVKKMKGAAITAPPPSDKSNEAKVEGETAVGDHPEVEQKNQAARPVLSKADKSSGDNDAVTGIQSIMEAEAAVVSLLGVATTIAVAPANAPKKSKAKKSSPSKRKTPATKAKKPAPPK